MEYLGEDPHLAYHMARAVVAGIQSQGVVACAKHYINNAQEGPGHNGRLAVSENVPDRAQHELYLPPFAGAVDAEVGAVMCAYNLINGTYACENGPALALLKGSAADGAGGLGFRGWVMSDWGATHSTVPSALAGLDQEMSGSGYFGDALAQAITAGQVPQARLDDMVLRILTSLFAAGVFDRHDYGTLADTVTSPAHSSLARRLAAEATVLLRNDVGALPINVAALRGQTVAVVGDENTVAGSGSGGVVGYNPVTPLAAIAARLAGTGVGVTNATYVSATCGCAQCEAQTPVVAQSQIDRAVEAARGAALAIVSVVTSSGEGYDRDSLSLGESQEALVAAVVAVCPQTVVVVRAPGAVTMPWATFAAAILLQLLPGQEAGAALADVLFGDVDPSGRLPLSFPAGEGPGDTWLASAAQYPGVATGGIGPATWNATYSEDLLVGYRWFDAAGVTPAFPFGFGLSYTTFAFSALEVQGQISATANASIGFTVTNTGIRQGAAVPQLYLAFPAAAGEPPQVLRGFVKVALDPGRSQRVSLPLSLADASVWDTAAQRWRGFAGIFGVIVGVSSRDLRLNGTVTVEA